MKKVIFIALICALSLGVSAQFSSIYPTLQVPSGSTITLLTVDTVGGYGGTYIKNPSRGVAGYVPDTLTLPNAAKKTSSHFTVDAYPTAWPVTYVITTDLYISDKKGTRYYLLKQK